MGKFKLYNFWENKKEIDYGFKIDNNISLCWLWLGASDKDGYGLTTKNYKTWRVHILSYKLTYPDNYNSNLLTLHKCNIKECFNPLHLYQGTQKDNVHDIIKANNNFYAKRNHCSKGHEYLKDNLIIYKRKNGYIERRCKKCIELRNNKTIIRRFKNVSSP